MKDLKISKELLFWLQGFVEINGKVPTKEQWWCLLIIKCV